MVIKNIKASKSYDRAGFLVTASLMKTVHENFVMPVSLRDEPPQFRKERRMTSTN